MKSVLVTRGKGRWRRAAWKYIPGTGIEAVILERLEFLERLEDNLCMMDTSYIDELQAYALMREAAEAELYHVLA